MATNTWVGVTNTTWGATPGAVSLNWSTGLVPTIADDVVIDATAPSDVVMTANAQCKSLDLTGFVGAFDMGGFELRHEGDCNISAFATYPNPGSLKTATSCTITPHGKTFKKLTINAPVTPAVVSIDGDITLTDRVQFLNNIANELALLGDVNIAATVDGAGIYCLDASKITTDDVEDHVVNFTPLAGSVANYIKPPTTRIPLNIGGTTGVILLASDGAATALKAYTFIQTGSVLDFNGINLTAQRGIVLQNDGGSFPAVWTHLGGRTITVEGGAGSNAFRFTASDQFAFEADADWFLVLPNEPSRPGVLFGGSIEHCDASGSAMDLYCTSVTTNGGNNSAEVLFGPFTTIDNVTSAKANGTYGVGEIIDVTVHFAGPFAAAVDVTGVPKLALELHPTRKVAYRSGSGGQTHTYRLVVQSPDQSTDLDYRSINALSLQGGTIKDSLGDNVVLTLPVPGAAGSLGANKALVISTPGVIGGGGSESQGFGKGWGFGL